MLLSKMTAMDPSKSTAIALLQRIGRTFFAAFWLVALPLGAWAASTTMQQSAYLQGTPGQSFEEVRNAAFKAYPKLKKLPLSEKAVWIRLHFGQVTKPEEDRYLMLKHELIEQIWLYRTNPHAPSQWTREHVHLDAEGFVRLGRVSTSDEVYLFIPSAVDTPLVAFVGTRDEVVHYENRIDIAIAIIVAVGLSVTAHFLLSSLPSFSLINVIGTSYSISFILILMTASGALRQLMPQLTINLIQMIYTFNIFILYFFASTFVCMVVSGLLKKTTVFKYAWNIPLLMFLIFLYSFIDLKTAFFLQKHLEAMMILVITLLIAIQLRINGFRTYKKHELFSFIFLIITSLTVNINRSRSNNLEIFNNNNLLETFDYPSILYFIGGGFFINLIIFQLLYSIAENTKRKELHQKLVDTNINYESEKLALAKQRQLTGMLTHEIKNPLAASQLALANMERNLNAKDFSIDRMSTIKQSLNEINTIIDKCVEVDLYEQGLLTTNARAVALKELISNLKTPANEDRIYIINRDVADEQYILGDPFYVKTILSNLVSNALKYSPEDSLVEVLFSTVKQGEKELLSVSISNEPGTAGYPDKTQVFNRFYRAESARSVSGSGTGLWLAKQMAHDLGAELELQDGAPNITFNILLKMLKDKR